jgi:hypothetical protein
MTDTPQLSGKDLARQALAAYKAASRTAPTTTPRARRKRTLRPGDGRDPVTLATAITGLGADLPLNAGLAGGTVLDQWPTLCPQYADTVQPVSYDEHTGRLDLRPASHAYAFQLRLLGGQLAKQINDKLGRAVVRTIRVLPVGAISITPATPAPEQPRAEPPVKTWETAHPGYRETLDAALTHRLTRNPADPYTVEAIARQDQALRARRLPEDEHTEYLAERERLERLAGPAPGSSEASRAAALAFKRRDAAGLTQPRTAFDVA